MVARAGPPKGGPVSVCAGSLNPVRVTTSELETSGGDLQNYTRRLPSWLPSLPRLYPQTASYPLWRLTRCAHRCS
ncbi:ash family protein [Enterobacter cloacae]|uniref:ash family protein n=1 Tax=Enterobacter cloacae TaxID=550 RepID=UPI002D1FA11F|nr:ash family protein [Enterobacter cloacae]